MCWQLECVLKAAIEVFLTAKCVTVEANYSTVCSFSEKSS